ncbi:hypothetical protein CEF00_13715, partial [Lactobacillus crispatus]
SWTTKITIHSVDDQEQTTEKTVEVKDVLSDADRGGEESALRRPQVMCSTVGPKTGKPDTSKPAQGGEVKVKDGAAGKDGKSITKAEVKNGGLHITLEGKEPINVGHVQGVKGTDGKTPTIEVGEKENGTTKITI